MSEPEDEIEEVEFSPSPLILGDGDCCIPDMDLLDPVNEYEGVLAVQFYDGQLFWLSGRDRKWHPAGSFPDAKPAIKRVK